MKYIVLQYQQSKNLPVKEDILFFPETIIHSDFADSMVHLYHMQLNCISVEPVSAGFCNLKTECFGESETLGLKSRPQDSDLAFAMQYHLNFIEE